MKRLTPGGRQYVTGMLTTPARMAEQADAMVSNTIVRKGMRVRIPLRAPLVNVVAAQEPKAAAAGQCGRMWSRELRSLCSSVSAAVGNGLTGGANGLTWALSASAGSAPSPWLGPVAIGGPEPGGPGCLVAGRGEIRPEAARTAARRARTQGPGERTPGGPPERVPVARAAPAGSRARPAPRSSRARPRA